MSESSRRELYRIQYPQMERPTLELGRSIFEVLDLSERGMRYEMGSDRRWPSVGTEIGGTIEFRRGDRIAVKGTVLRASNDGVVLQLDPPVPFGEILAEQRYLRGRGYVLKS